MKSFILAFFLLCLSFAGLMATQVPFTQDELTANMVVNANSKYPQYTLDYIQNRLLSYDDWVADGKLHVKISFEGVNGDPIFVEAVSELDCAVVLHCLDDLL